MYQTEVLDKVLSFIYPGRSMNMVFQHDNAPPHVSHSSAQYLVDNGVTLLPRWPPCSPDLNPVEHCWAYIAKGLKGKRFRNADELFDGVKEAWEAVPQSLIRNLYLSMKARLRAVIAARGGATPY